MCACEGEEELAAGLVSVSRELLPSAALKKPCSVDSVLRLCSNGLYSKSCFNLLVIKFLAQLYEEPGLVTVSLSQIFTSLLSCAL